MPKSTASIEIKIAKGTILSGKLTLRIQGPYKTPVFFDLVLSAPELYLNGNLYAPHLIDTLSKDSLLAGTFYEAHRESINRVCFENPAGGPLSLCFTYEYSYMIAPPGVLILIRNEGDTIPTTYYTTPLSAQETANEAAAAAVGMAAAESAAAARAAAARAAAAKALTVMAAKVPLDIVEAMAQAPGLKSRTIFEWAGGYLEIPSAVDRSCGNCARYHLLDLYCHKSKRRNVDPNTACFTGYFKTPNKG